MRTYRGCIVHTELIKLSDPPWWIAYVLESVVVGAGGTPTEAINHMISIMEEMPNYGIDVIKS